MKSWDLFDTLIGRTCGTPNDLFLQMAREFRDVDFPWKRKAAERRLQDAKVEYSLEDIYSSFADLYGISSETAKIYAVKEWELELENVFPIKEYVDQLQDGDIIVSDMYLSATQLKKMMKVAGIKTKHKVYVSCYGKHLGTVWNKLPEKSKIEYHTGDNRASDCDTPRRYGVNTKFASTSLSPNEQFYLRYSRRFAYWLRKERLKANLKPDGATKLHFIQLQYNIPFLWASAHALSDYYRDKKLSNLLFMSRDCQIFIEIFHRMFPEIKCEYIYISRDCLISKSNSFFYYLNKKFARDVSLVDISASGGSLRAACDNLKVDNPRLWTPFFLKEPFKVELGPIQLTSITDNVRTRCNNSHLERLNYADHLHVKDVTRKGIPSFDQEGEYDMKLVKKYQEFIFGIIPTIPTERPASIYDVVDYSLRGINSHSLFLQGVFPNHGIFERKRKEEVRKKNSDVVIAAANWGYEWNRIKIWYSSIRRSGFTGDVYMFDLGTPAETVKHMTENGIHVIHHETTQRDNIIERFNALANLAKTLNPQTWIIFSDSDDLVFQKNPVEYIKNVPAYKKILVTTEGVAFKDNSWAQNNLAKAFPQKYNALCEKHFCNAGSFAGTAEMIGVLASKIVALCDSSKNGSKHDQAALNILLYEEPIKSIVQFSKPWDGWCFCAASSLFTTRSNKFGYRGPLPRVVNGLCLFTNRLIPVMFHHYTRNEYAKRQVVNRYK